MKKYIVILTILSVSLFQSCGEPAEGHGKIKRRKKDNCNRIINSPEHA